MWLAFSTLFGFTVETGIPEQFQHSNHLFYSQRCIRLEEADSKAAKWHILWRLFGDRYLLRVDTLVPARQRHLPPSLASKQDGAAYHGDHPLECEYKR